MDLVQLGIEYIEYEIIGKGFGAVGNIILAVYTYEYSSKVAAVIGFTLWCIVEAARWAAEIYMP